MGIKEIKARINSWSWEHELGNRDLETEFAACLDFVETHRIINRYMPEDRQIWIKWAERFIRYFENQNLQKRKILIMLIAERHFFPFQLLAMLELATEVNPDKSETRIKRIRHLASRIIGRSQILFGEDVKYIKEIRYAFSRLYTHTVKVVQVSESNKTPSEIYGHLFGNASGESAISIK